MIAWLRFAVWLNVVFAFLFTAGTLMAKTSADKDAMRHSATGAEVSIAAYAGLIYVIRDKRKNG